MWNPQRKHCNDMLSFNKISKYKKKKAVENKGEMNRNTIKMIDFNPRLKSLAYQVLTKFKSKIYGETILLDKNCYKF